MRFGDTYRAPHRCSIPDKGLAGVIYVVKLISAQSGPRPVDPLESPSRAWTSAQRARNSRPQRCGIYSSGTLYVFVPSLPGRQAAGHGRLSEPFPIVAAAWLHMGRASAR